MKKAENTGFTKELAAFIAGLTWDNIPDTVVERAKYIILDGLGCGLYGSLQPWSQIMVDTLRKLDGDTGKATVWGRDVALSAPHAALANSTAVQGFELDDVHYPAVMHCESLTIPAALALCEQNGGMTGRQLLTAVIAGCETGPRAGMCMRGREMLERGWHSGSIVGGFASAATSANLLGLSPEQTEHAFGIAGSGASGLMAAQYGAMVKRMQHGRACQNGVYASLLASGGFTGIEDVFEVPYGGFCTTFTQSQTEFDLSALTAGLGEDFETMRVRIKLYPCVGGSHGSVNTALLLKQREGFAFSDIAGVRITGAKAFVDHGGWPFEGRNVTEAQMNMSYSIAAALADDELTVSRYTEDAIKDLAVLDLARRITIYLDPDAPIQGGGERITIHLNSGKIIEQQVEPAKGLGSPPEHYPEAEAVEKFRDLAGRVVSEARVREIEAMVLGLDTLDDARQLAVLLKIN
jgi:aconitate decarboxylase